ncbi:MAG: phosphoglycerate dehydrogenase [Eubacteriales bacterium]
MKKVRCLNPIAQKGLDLLGQDKYTIVDEENAEAILVRSYKMHDMDLPKNLEAIGRAGAGVNNIPIDKCSEEGIVVFNTPGANANGVKELVIASLFLSSRDIIGGVEWVNGLKGETEISKKVEKGKKQFAGPEILGKKLGVIGLGAIGSMVANAARSLGMEVVGYDPFISVEAAWGLSRTVKRCLSLDELVSDCDYISIHVPLLDATKGILNKDMFSKMKDNVRIFNFSRAGLVNEDDLEEAINSGKVAKYVTDFPNERVLGMNNVINIPHLGASTPESEENCAIMAVNEIVDYIENGNITNSVNYPACNMGVCSTVSRIAINHKNIPNMVGQITTLLANKGLNIADMLNKSKEDWAYTLIDIEDEVSENVVNEIKNIEGIVKVRVL